MTALNINKYNFEFKDTIISYRIATLRLETEIRTLSLLYLCHNNIEDQHELAIVFHVCVKEEQMFV